MCVANEGRGRVVVQELSSLSKKENIVFWFLVFGFEKNAKSNISFNEEKLLKLLLNHY